MGFLEPTRTGNLSKIITHIFVANIRYQHRHQYQSESTSKMKPNNFDGNWLFIFVLAWVNDKVHSEIIARPDF